MAEDNQIKISMRASDNEVQAQIDRTNAKLEEMKSKLRDVGKESRSSTREAKQGFDEADGAVAKFGETIKGAGLAMLSAFSIDAIRNFVNEIIREQQRLAEESRRGTAAISTTLAQTGDLARYSDIQKITRDTASPIQSEAERLQVFKAIRDAAPGMPIEQATQLYQTSLSSGARLYGGDPTATAAFGTGAAQIANLGSIGSQQAADVAAFVGAQQGSQDALKSGTQLGQILLAAQPSMGSTGAMEAGLGLSMSVAQAGFNPRASVAAFGTYSSYLRTQYDKTKNDLIKSGMPNTAAEQAARNQVYGGGMAEGFLSALGETDPALRQQMLGEGASRLGPVSAEVFARNVAAIRGAGGYLENQVANLPPEIQAEVDTVTATAGAGMGGLTDADMSGRTRRSREYELLRAGKRERYGYGLRGAMESTNLYFSEFLEATNDVIPGLEFTPYGIPGIAARGRRFSAMNPDESFVRPVEAQNDRQSGAPQGSSPPIVNVTINQTPDGQIVDYSANLDSMDVR